MEAELGEERQPDPVKPGVAELPLPDGPMTVGLDGGYVRAAHKEGCFEVCVAGGGGWSTGSARNADRAVEGPKISRLPKVFGIWSLEPDF